MENLEKKLVCMVEFLLNKYEMQKEEVEEVKNIIVDLMKENADYRKRIEELQEEVKDARKKADYWYEKTARKSETEKAVKN